MRLGGRPAAGEPADVGEPASPRAVIWVDNGDELLVHLDSIRTTSAERLVLVAIDVQSDQTGRQTLVVPFAVGDAPGGEPSVVFEAFARGPEALARRWGSVLQEALYAALLDLAAVHAAERGTLPVSPYLRDGALRFGRAERP